MKKIIIILLVLQSCLSRRDFRHFTLYNVNPNSEKSKLRLDGVYYQTMYEEYEGRKSHFLHSFALYNNGVYLDMAYSEHYASLTDERKVIEKKLKLFVETYKNNLDIANKSVECWGRFKINNDTIIIQDFEQCNRPWIYRVRERRGIILNDSTIKINSEYYKIRCQWEDFGEKKKYEELNEIYHLYKTNYYKPDSTNQFTTNKRIVRKLDRLEEKRKGNEHRKQMNLNNK